MKEMILDVDGAYEHHKKKRPEDSKGDFLKKIGMSRQTASNLQNGAGKQKGYAFAQKIKELTGLSMDELIKPKYDE